MSILPSNWVTAPLGAFTDDCIQRVPGEAETFTYIDIGSVSRETKQIESPQRLLGKDAPSRARKHVRAGDVLVSMTRPNLNAVALVPEHLDGQIASTGFDVLRASSIDPRWVFYLVRSAKFVEAMSELVQGALYPAVRSKDVRGFEAALAPRVEQTRIADKLDAMLARVDTCRNRLVRVPAIIKRFRQSVLAAATSGRLTEDWRDQFPDRIDATNIAEKIHASHEAAGGHKMGNAAAPTEDVHDLSIDMFPSGWGLVTLRDIVLPDRPITYGILKPGPELDDGVPYIRVADFPGDKLNPATVRKTSRQMDEEFKRSRLRSGDLLLSIRGTVGRIVVIPDELENANITQDSARLSVQPVVNRDYVLWYLRSEMAQQRMKGSTKGVAVRGINIGDVRALQLPLPSREEQNEIVRRIEKLFAFADRLEARYTAAHAQVDKLTPSLLAKAFRGELVPQDTNDEPASVLLDRIRAARSKASTEPKLRARRAGLSNTEVPMLTTDKNAPDYLTAILRRSSGHTLDAKALWRESQLSIPDFYEKLKAEADRGLLQEIKKEARSFLEAV